MTRWRIETTIGRTFIVYSKTWTEAEDKLYAYLGMDTDPCWGVNDAGRWHRGRLELPPDETITTQGRDT